MVLIALPLHWYGKVDLDFIPDLHVEAGNASTARERLCSPNQQHAAEAEITNRVRQGGPLVRLHQCVELDGDTRFPAVGFGAQLNLPPRAATQQLT